MERNKTRISPKKASRQSGIDDKVTRADNPETSEHRSHIEWNETLEKMARYDIYRINAFRVLGLPVTASNKQISASTRKTELMEKFGNAGQDTKSILPLFPEPDNADRREAQQRLLDPELRFIDEFFWFWPLSSESSEDEAFTAIEKNDLMTAWSLWRDHELNGSEANVSVHNLAVLYHAQALDIERMEAADIQTISDKKVTEKKTFWKEAFSRWKSLLDDEGFWQRARQRVEELDDPRLTIDTIIRIREGLPATLLLINAKLAVEAAEMDDRNDAIYHRELMEKSGFDDSIIEEALRHAITPIRNRLKSICSHVREETSNKPRKGALFATEFIEETEPLLQILRFLLPKRDSTRESAHDEVALQVRSCLIAHCNETDNWDIALKLAKQSLAIAASSSTKRKIEEDIETISLNLTYDTCWFCKANSADPGAEAEVKMYGDINRAHTFTGTNVEWRRVSVPVPRCGECKKIHKKQRIFNWSAAILGIILGLVIGMVIEAAFHNGIVSLVVFLAFSIGGFINRWLIVLGDTKPESYKKEFPRVKELQDEGWGIGEKPPGVS